MDTESLYIFYKEMLEEPDFDGGWTVKGEPRGAVSIECNKQDCDEIWLTVRYEVEDISLTTGVIDVEKAAKVMANLFPDPTDWHFSGDCHCEENQNINLYNLAFFKLLAPSLAVLTEHYDRPMIYVSTYHVHEFLTLHVVDRRSKQALWLFAPVKNPHSVLSSQDVRTAFTKPVGGAIYVISCSVKAMDINRYQSNYERVLAADVEARFGDVLPRPRVEVSD